MKQILKKLAFILLGICIFYSVTEGQSKEGTGKGTTLTISKLYDTVIINNNINQKQSGVPLVRQVSEVRMSTIQGKEVTSALGFQVDQPYPNPFNKEISISYRLPQEGKVNTQITDLSGQVLKTWLEYQSSGNQILVWNGTDSAGNELKPGIYFCIINYKGLRKVCKLIKN